MKADTFPTAARPPLRTTLPRAALALAVGACVGGGSVAVLATLAAGLLIATGGGGSDPVALMMMALLTGLVATVVYMFGLALIGAPAWWLMHSCGLRERWACAALGAFLNGGVMLALQLPSPSPNMWITPAIFAAIGALVGAVIWRVAYERPTPDYLSVW
jgi:hypothetical protein